MRQKFPTLIASVCVATAIGISGCATSSADGTVSAKPDVKKSAAVPGDARDQFMATLASMCGHRFEGGMTFPLDAKHDFAGKRLTADIATCNTSGIRVPFQVGEDKSRTWVFTRSPLGLQLKHDHRHPDGTPDAVTMYGGMASGSGSALMQSFAADDYTGKLIAGAATNVWTLTLSADGRTLTYHLERDAKPRFTAVLKRVTR